MRFDRACGVLLHPSSLPGPHGSGDFGPSAYHFVDWLVAGGQKLWQILPLAPLGPGNSPYMGGSAFAGNVLLIDLAELHQRGWLDASDLSAVPGLDAPRIDWGAVFPYRYERLARAARNFTQRATAADRAEHDAFCAAHADWLPDYALFMALFEHLQWRDWCDWPGGLATRQPAAIAAAREEHAERIAFWTFTQWCFFRQWARIRAYANERGVKVVGDMPIFIAYNSADAWAKRELFELTPEGRQTVVAGVPPDSFSATGQRWGNPLYRWSAHEAEGYAWWIDRVRRTFELVDIVRIDHFRGFAGYFEIPASEPTAEKGRWMPGPGEALFRAIAEALGPLPIIAEDLGVITPDVDALRHAFAFPGMRILQFAFGSTPAAERRFLPHRYTSDSVVYTGSHDNDTTLGWWHAASEDERHHLREYLASDGMEPHWALMRAACASVADSAVFPMQDVMGLDGAHRMNFPGKADGNWSWRFRWDEVPRDAAARLRHLCTLYERC